MCQFFESIGLQLFLRFALMFGLAICVACEVMTTTLAMFMLIDVRQADYLMTLAMVALVVAIVAWVFEWRLGDEIA